MLFKYNYVHDDAEKLQELVRHIVIDVWAEANIDVEYSIDLISNEYFLPNGDVENFRSKVSRTPNLKNPIKEIYEICQVFNDDKKDYICQTFNINNNIEVICNNTITPRFYNDLEDHVSEEFSTKVKEFFNKLFESIFKQAPFNLNGHYTQFMGANKKLCPTCGLNTLEPDSSNHRDDYDHYLPKEKYPFNAVNLRNLMPICSDCNKKWKKKANPVENSLGTCRAFYYYGTTDPDVAIRIIINDLDNCDIEVQLMSATMQEEVDSWNRVYSIERRYKEHVVCHEEVGKGWFREAKANFDRDPAYNIDSAIDFANMNRLENKNFIKAPFLQECKNKGLIFDEENVLLDMIANEQRELSIR